MDERTLREYYTAQFRDLIKQSSPGSIMSSYNEVNGVPSAANTHLIDELARETFGFQGYFTSDCDAVFEIQAGHHWQPPEAPQPLDAVGRTAFSNSAGEDLDCNQGFHDGSSFANTIPTAVAQKIVTQTGTYNENDVDSSLVRLFTARMETGEFDNEAKVPWVAEARKRLAPGSWTNTDANNAVTETPARLAMARKAGDQSIVLLKNDAVKQRTAKPPSCCRCRCPPRELSGSPWSATSRTRRRCTSAVTRATRAPLVRPRRSTATTASRPRSRRSTRTPSSTTFPVRSRARRAPSMPIRSRPLRATTLSSCTRVRTTARRAESKDRSSLALPNNQASLISQVAAVNPNTIVYMETLGEVDVNSFQNQVPAMLWSSYNGQRKGESLADVVLGTTNPSGRLPFTWYKDVQDLPAMTDYAIRPTATSPGRTYMYYNGPVSYPFGYGLGYSDYTYSNMHVSSKKLDANGTLRVTADVTNTGSRSGDEVAQLYVTTPDASAALQRPLKRLEGFTKISVRAHRTKHVSFTVKVPQLAFFSDSANRYSVDDGRYGIQLSTSSADQDVQQQAFITVHGALDPTPRPSPPGRWPPATRRSGSPSASSSPTRQSSTRS